jgi:hypothetical protein
MAQQDFNAGPRGAAFYAPNSFEARSAEYESKWERDFDLQETANDYLRQLVDKTSQTVIYGIN